MPKSEAEVHFEAKSIVAQRNQEGYVIVTLGSSSVQVTPEEARTYARWLAEAAEAADQDAFMWRFFTRKVGLGIREIAALMTEFRQDRVRERKD